MRLFVALTPPAAVTGEVLTAIGPLRADHPELRWTRPEQWHLTLAFLGEVDDRSREDLTGRLGRVAARNPPLVLSFGAGGRFGDRVLWTRVRGETAGLVRLAGAVQAAARRAGLAVDERPYRPHLTLARVRDASADLRSAASRLDGFDGRAWTADELQLVRSHLAAGPERTARHEVVAAWPLGRGPA